MIKDHQTKKTWYRKGWLKADIIYISVLKKGLIFNCSTVQGFIMLWIGDLSLVGEGAIGIYAETK